MFSSQKNQPVASTKDANVEQKAERSNSTSTPLYKNLQDYKRETPAHVARSETVNDQTAPSSTIGQIWNETFKSSGTK